VREVLTGPGCPKCAINAAGPSSVREAGVAFMNPGLRVRTSQTEQRLRMLLGRRIRLHHGVNAVRIARTFFGRQEVWPDILVPQLRIAVEYDDPGRSRRAHKGLKEASDLEKDEALREVGWEVVRIRAGGLEALGGHSVVCNALTPAAVDEVVACMRRIRGDAAVDAIATGHPAAS
jgi:very-short-patch-repair endonuclease